MTKQKYRILTTSVHCTISLDNFRLNGCFCCKLGHRQEPWAPPTCRRLSLYDSKIKFPFKAVSKLIWSNLSVDLDSRFRVDWPWKTYCAAFCVSLALLAGLGYNKLQWFTMVELKRAADCNKLREDRMSLGWLIYTWTSMNYFQQFSVKKTSLPLPTERFPLIYSLGCNCLYGCDM